MKQTTLKLAALVMLLGATVNVTKAQNSDPINVVTTAVPFLRISPDARGGAMGETGIATSADANSAFWNIAKTPFATNKVGISASYTPWLKDLGLNDVYFATLSGYYQLDETQSFSGSLRYFSLGNIQFTDNAGNNLNEGRPREFSLDAGYSRKLSSKMGLGVALRYINSSLANGTQVNGVNYKAGTSVAGDIHFFYKGTNAAGNGFDYGATLSNLGSKIAYTSDANQKDFIPANLGLGASYNKVFDADNKITFALDLNKLLVPTPPAGNADSAAISNYRTKGVVSSWFSSLGDGDDLQEVSVAVGAEYWYKNQFAFRAGYFSESKQKGDRRYFTMGAGLKYNTYGLNFAYLMPTGTGITRNPLSNTVRFSVLFDMSK
jgi:hypothetical protein